MAQCMNALADKVQKQEVPCTHPGGKVCVIPFKCALLRTQIMHAQRIIARTTRNCVRITHNNFFLFLMRNLFFNNEEE